MKEDYLKWEEGWLSPYAVLSKNTKGRVKDIAPCPMRTEFQRDRDRIIHSKAFRRLKHKTQVFLAPTGDHYRTRLTHTLEVTQIARTISRNLRLNEDLTEAIGLGHDLGHTPFGHIGESVLRKISGHFEHNEQSLRVVDFLEDSGKGLNLTYEVRDGIVNHKMSRAPMTLEGKVVSFSDRIAYLNHDIDDAIEAELIKESDLPKDVVTVLGNDKNQRINTLVMDIINNSTGKAQISMSEEISNIMTVLYNFMFERVYYSKEILKEEKKAENLIKYLYDYFINHFDKVPKNYHINTDDKKIAVVDYIASMSDVFAIRTASELILPDTWEA